MVLDTKFIYLPQIQARKCNPWQIFQRGAKKFLKFYQKVNFEAKKGLWDNNFSLDKKILIIAKFILKRAFFTITREKPVK